MLDFKNKDIVSKMTIIGIGLAAVIIIVAIIAAVMSMGGGSDTEVVVPEEVETPVEEEVSDVEKVYERVLAVVKHVDTASDSLMIYDIENLKLITLKMDSSIEIKDEYGTDIALAQVDVGDMVESKYDTISSVPETVKITAKTWERKDVSNMVVDTDNSQIRISNDVYNYTEELVTSDDGRPFDISTLSTADEAVVRGYKDMVWSVVLISGHGTVTLINHDVFVGGQLEVGNRLSYTIEEEMSVALAAGVHQIVVNQDNMSPYVKQILVEEGEEVVIDLSEAQPKVGQVEIIVLQDDVTVYLDDVELNLEEELILDFGTYTVKAEKENYVTWESELVLTQAYQQFEIDLDKTPTYVFINEPAGADAYLDGVLIGTIPTQAPFTPGNHTIQLQRDGYKTSEVYKYIWEDDGMDKYLVLPELIEIVVENEEEEEVTVEFDIYGNPVIKNEDGE